MSNVYQNQDRDELNKHYVRQIRNLPMLTLEEEYELAKKWRDDGDSQAVEQLVASHLRLVAKVASGYRGYGLPLSDLVAEGNIGMMQAMKHYDPDRGFRLSTYAMWWIKASIQDYILRTWSLVKIGTTSAQKRLFFSLRKAQRQIHAFEEGELNPEIVAALAKKLSVDESEIHDMNQRLAGDRSLNVTVRTSEEEAPEWIEWLVDDRENQEMQTIHSDELSKRRTLLENAMTCLNEREHQIFRERRLKDPPLTLEEISANVGISRERVRQIEFRSFEKIQKEIKRLAVENYRAN
ncbi:MAG: RNA polymerase sigma factor RpoH [Alphaproteobacteria bacterium]|nr:RNA polymerase sigma factor RpoH [Alphaproteobacteria bacterium]